MPTVFITRNVPYESPFRRLLEAAGWTVEGRSLLALTPLPPAPLPPADWIFFYSANAVRFFFALYPAAAPGHSVRWAAIGPATAAALERYTGRVDFTGTGDPASAAEAFVRLARGKRVLFPGALNSRQSIQHLLGAAVDGVELAIYDNRPIPDPPASTAGVLVFTSPMNAQAYFSCHRLLPGQRLLAIGASTAGALRELGYSDVRTAASPDEASLAEGVEAIEREREKERK